VKNEDWLEVQVFTAEEINAVRSGELDGTVYKDGVYADVKALAKWREDAAARPRDWL
jgi:hypothetical protein